MQHRPISPPSSFPRTREPSSVCGCVPTSSPASTSWPRAAPLHRRHFPPDPARPRAPRKHRARLHQQARRQAPRLVRIVFNHGPRDHPREADQEVEPCMEAAADRGRQAKMARPRGRSRLRTVTVAMRRLYPHPNSPPYPVRPHPRSPRSPTFVISAKAGTQGEVAPRRPGYPPSRE